MVETLPCGGIQGYPKGWEDPHSCCVSASAALSAAISYSVCAKPSASVTCQPCSGHCLSPPQTHPSVSYWRDKQRASESCRDSGLAVKAPAMEEKAA